MKSVSSASARQVRISRVSTLARKVRHFAGIFFLSALLMVGSTDFVAAANEYDGFLWYVRLWVPELPPPKKKLSPEKQTEFKDIWFQTGVASKKLLSAWELLLQKDPLTGRALKALDRCGELELQSNSLRKQLISQYGKQKFRELEARGARWLKNQQADWLDLKDERLVQLAVHVCKMNDYRWLIESEAFSQFIENDKEQLTEKEAIAVYTAGIQWKRKQLKDDNYFPDLSDLMRKYLEGKAEADFLYYVGETYLRMTPDPNVEQAKQEFSKQIKRASVIRPDLNDMLIEIYKKKNPQPPAKNQRSAKTA